MDGICLHLNFIKHPEEELEPICCFGCSVPVALAGQSRAQVLLGARVGGRAQAQSPGQQQAGPSTAAPTNTSHPLCAEQKHVSWFTLSQFLN